MNNVKTWLKNHKEGVKDVCAATVSAVTVYSLITTRYRDKEANEYKLNKIFNKTKRA
jgi:hypothetical protein